MLILADAFEEFRTGCMKPHKKEVDPKMRFDYNTHLLVSEDGNYELDLAQYVTAPEFSFYAMRKQTQVKLEFITHPKM